MDRRKFLTTVAGAAAAAAFPHHLFASDKPKLASDRIKLGPKQVELSRLAMGTGTNGSGGGSNQTRKLGVQGLAELLGRAHDQGVNFWDTADQYGSHPHIKEALKTVPRDKVTILTKTHASTDKEMRADLDRFRRELGTDHIDILLLHCMFDGDWNVKRRGAMDVISEAQQKGIVRTCGVSCHSLEALKTAAKEPWVEVDLARLNPAKVEMDADVPTVVSVLKEMKAAGKGVIGMKVFGAGKLRDKQDEMLQYTLAQDCIDCFTIGTESPDEFQDLMTRISKASTRA
jgi:aryl-alcohol dehydrogenase-like predicted oxidoreductase